MDDDLEGGSSEDDEDYETMTAFSEESFLDDSEYDYDEGNKPFIGITGSNASGKGEVVTYLQRQGYTLFLYPIFCVISSKNEARQLTVYI
ncbi:MAG: hypothetical protein R3A45_03940 [Bdellovibrionota bacterium]